MAEDPLVTRQIVANYKIFTENLKLEAVKESGSRSRAHKTEIVNVPPESKTKAKKCRGKRKPSQNSTKQRLKSRKSWQAKHKTADYTRETEERFFYRKLPQVCVELIRPKQQEVEVKQEDLLAKMQEIEETTPYTELVNELTSENANECIVQIEPKLVRFICENPDNESKASIFLTNRTQNMEIYKVKTTNPYLFRVTPSTGYVFPQETLEVHILLLEGVDVQNDRFLVMVAKVADEIQVDKMSVKQLTKLWRSREPNLWTYVYQEKISCAIIGQYREKSKVLVSAFKKADGMGENTDLDIAKPATVVCSKPQSTTSELLNIELSDSEETAHEKDLVMSVNSAQTLSDVVTEQVLGKLQKENADNSLALVPYSNALNRNTNAKIEEWLESVPTEQVPMVEGLYNDLMNLKHQSHSLKLRLKDMSSRLSSSENDKKNMQNQQQLLSGELGSVKSQVERMMLVATERGQLISPEKLKKEFISRLETLTKGIEEVVQQHDDIWRQLKKHDKILEQMKVHGGMNRSGNAVTSKENEPNQTQNARVDHHFIYDERRGDRETISEIKQNQAAMGKEMAEIAAHISGLSRRAETMAEVLKNVTHEMKQQRKDANNDMGKLEMKYLHQCALLPMQELGKHNQEMITNLYTSFMAHIEKVTNTLDKLMTEHRALSHFLDHQTMEFTKLKKAVCEVGKGIHAEHQHILEVSAANTRRYEQLEMFQNILENHMKDIHVALKNVMEKAKIIAQRINNLEHDFGNHKNEINQKLGQLRRTSMSLLNNKNDEFDSQIENLKDKINDLLNEIRRLKDQANANEASLREQAASLRQHKDTTANQIAQLEQRAHAQIEQSLQEARRNFDSQKAKIAGFQGTLKSMDALLMSANEKLKTLYGDLERYKRAITEEMHRLAKEIADQAERQMEEIQKTHAAMKKQMDGLLGTLTKAQMEAKAVSARLTELENDLQKKFGTLNAELKKAIKDATTALAVRAQKSELFQAKAEEDLRNLGDELQGINNQAALIIAKMDDVENRTRQKVEDMKAALEDVMNRIDNLTSAILEEFYNKMQKAGERLQEQLQQLQANMTNYVDSKIEELARKNANATKDQLAEIFIKMEHSDRLTEAVRIQMDRDFYILIILLILLGMFMISAFMGKTMLSPANQINTWWKSCCGNFFIGRRIREEL